MVFVFCVVKWPCLSGCFVRLWQAGEQYDFTVSNNYMCTIIEAQLWVPWCKGLPFFPCNFWVVCTIDLIGSAHCPNNCTVDLSWRLDVTQTKDLTPSIQGVLHHWAIPGGRPEIVGGQTDFPSPRWRRGHLDGEQQKQRREYGECLIPRNSH